jgi:hypothetical protein
MGALPPLLILTWNANSLRHKYHELEVFLEQHHVDIACITETKLAGKQFPPFSNFSVVRFDRKAETLGGGVAVLIRQNIPFSKLPLVTTLETVGVEIAAKPSPIRILAAYNPPGKQLTDEDLTKIFSSQHPTILAGDFNSKHLGWNCRVENPNGRHLHKLCLRHNLHVYAPLDPTYVSSNHEPDILDFFITSGISPVTSAVAYAKSALSSDHNPVFLALDNRPTRSFLVIKKVNWVLYQHIVEQTLPSIQNIESSSDIDRAAMTITSCITGAVSEATTTFVPKRCHFLPRHIRQLINDKNSVRNRWQRSRNPSDKTLLNHLQLEVKFALDDLSAQSEIRDLEEAEEHPQQVFRVINKLTTPRQQPNFPNLKVGDKIATTDQEKSELIADSLQNQCSPNPFKADNFRRHGIVVADVVRKYLIKPSPAPIEFTSPSEVKEIIANLRPKKAPGHDGVSNQSLKLLPLKGVVFLTNLTNSIFRIGYFPKDWKLAIVISIRKPQKPPSNPTSYRPISLLPTMAKLVERVLLSRLGSFMTQQHILPDTQFGFRKGHSTTQQLMRVTSHVTELLNQRKFVSMLLLDISQAFDRVWHSGLLYKLINLGFPRYIITFIASFLGGRQIRAKVGNALSSPRKITSGVPQGSILGPVLYNIFVSDLPDCLDSRLLRAEYADDIALVSATVHRTDSTRFLNSYVSNLVFWMNTWRIQVNSTKCQAIHFSNYRIPPDFNIIVDQQPIPWVDKVKYLGVWMDRRLKWAAQARYARQKANVALGKISGILRPNSPLSPPVRLRVVQALVLSVLSYALPIWGTCNHRRLESFYNRALRRAANVPWFVKNKHIRASLNMPTFSEYLDNIAVRFWEKALVHENPLVTELCHHVPKPRDKVKRPSDLPSVAMLLNSAN